MEGWNFLWRPWAEKVAIAFFIRPRERFLVDGGNIKRLYFKCIYSAGGMPKTKKLSTASTEYCMAGGMPGTKTDLIARGDCYWRAVGRALIKYLLLRKNIACRSVSRTLKHTYIIAGIIIGRRYAETLKRISFSNEYC